jgi:hypothetical protein
MKAGIVIYRRDGSSLSGQWTHQDIGGLLAKELVQNVPSGPMVGNWPVQVSAPDGSVIFTGWLQAATLGKSLLLTWDETMAGGQPKFVGLGYQINDDLMVASFEPAASEGD